MLTLDKITEQERLSQSEEALDLTKPRKRSKRFSVAFPMFILFGEGRALDYTLPLHIHFQRQDFGDVWMPLTSELQKQFNY